MSTINWDEVKFRASSWGAFMTDPVTKAAKDAGELSETCKKELHKIYNLVKYGRRKEIITAAMDKGKLVEADSIAMYGALEGVFYQKNDLQLENDWACGHPDVFSGEDIYHAETCDDMKNSWELDSFTPWLTQKPDKDGICQLNIYYCLTGAKSGSLVRALMDCPPEVLEGEKYRLLRNMNVVSQESPEYVKAEAELVKNLTFPDIPPQERLIKIPVERDDELIARMEAKVPSLRNYLKELEIKHTSLYPK